MRATTSISVNTAIPSNDVAHSTTGGVLTGYKKLAIVAGGVVAATSLGVAAYYAYKVSFFVD